MESTLTIGNSLSVPSVHVLSATLGNATSDDIPERYIRPESESEPVAAEADVELPVIDLGRARTSQEERSKLGLACEDWGFFQLINHGVPETLIEKMKIDVAEFFNLPLEEKEALATSKSGCLEGYGQHFIQSEDQKLDWADLLTLVTHPHSSRNTKFWPSKPTTFRENFDTYTSAVKEVVNCLLKLVADNLGIDPEILMNKFEDMSQHVRMNHYPPCPNPSKVIGNTAHSDSGCLTILLQANNVQGLQIRKNDMWFPVKPQPGAFVVNVGDSLEILTNGKYKSIEHRAMVNIEKERLSIAVFHATNLDCILRPLPEIVRRGEENYSAISYKDYMKGYIAERLRGKKRLKSMIKI